MTSHSINTPEFKQLRLLLALSLVLGLLVPIVLYSRWTDAASATAISLSGGVGTVTVGSTLYARQGGALTLTVTTDNTTKCVRVTDGTTSVDKDSASAQTSWTFTSADSAALFTAGGGNGVKTLTATAFKNSNSQHKCTGNQGEEFGTQVASYILDNAGPIVTGAVAPTPNAAGWNNANVTITWSATDAGSGVASGPTPATDGVAAETAGVTKTSSATDRLGNSGSGSVTIKLDKTLPSINATSNPAANANNWNNTNVTVSFTCSDALSDIKSCTGGGSVVVSSEGANQSVPGTAVDSADNANNAGVTGINIDKTAPTLSGAPTTSPNGAGWYNGDVTIHWIAADGLSGLDPATVPGDSTINNEGTSKTATASVSDKAGNSSGTIQSAPVNIDKTPPNTTATAPANWKNTDVTVSLNASDALSGSKATYYKLNSGAQQSGTSVTISDEGVHTLEFWSEDKAGNVEQAKTVEVKIDKTKPEINHTQAPAANGNGWSNSNVTVTFTCLDGGSGIASCTEPQTVTTEGKDQPVTGTATDNAGNTASDPATVSIDKTLPTISGSVAGTQGNNGWYRSDVVVSFSCSDPMGANNTAGSGLASCELPKPLGEGTNQSASGTATDAADNSASATVSGINVDKTAPSLGGAATTSPNLNGWYNGDVIIHWTCSDALSGIAGGCPADSTIGNDAEGSDLSSSQSVSDLAGNTTNATVAGIKIDRTAPSTSASVPDPLESGWYAGAVQVTLSVGSDLSGVDQTYYSVDNDPAQLYSGPFSHNTKGIHTITFWSVDKAGNTEPLLASNIKTLKIDGVPPTITGSRTPAANGNGWNNSPVTVSFACSDEESGIAGCTPASEMLSSEGSGQSATGNALDNAGNTNSATVGDINIDLTAPTLSGAPTTNPNAFGWYKGDVTIHWTGQDGLSGIDPTSQPADNTITGEGSGLGAGPANISDKAGNVGSGSVSGIKIDRTAPSISGATVNDNGTPRSPNAGWFNSAVRVWFSCSDALSGVQECATDVVLNSDGANQSASGTATDKADNSASATASGINIDSQAPKTDADLQCTGKNGYCRGNKATVVLTANDQAGLSGVKEIRYSTNNGSSWQSGSSPVNVDINLNGSGKTKVLFYAVDNAGNSETQDGVEVKYDTIAPTVTHTLNPAANAASWNKANVTVHFDANDDSDGSGIDPSTVTADQTVSTETAGTIVNGSAEDNAGNLGTDSVTVKLDKTAPTTSGAPTTSPNANGWYNDPVTVHFTCADALSGVATCPTNVVLSTDGANQGTTGTAVDNAGNSASSMVSGINIDSIKPTMTLNGIANGGIYTLGAVPAASCNATDGGSGVDGTCSVSVSGGNANGVGTFTFTATAKDKAGNTVTTPGSYKVVYNVQTGVAFFLQPINDTAHQTGLTTSVFKAGSTVPVKFQLKDANGNVVQASNLPLWLTPVKGSAMTAPVDESVYSDTPTTGGTYRWDSTAQQYQYNWGTPKNGAGNYWRVGVMLDDGQTYYVNIGLR